VALSFILAESALELVPEEIRRSPAVASDSRRRGKEPFEILLDRSFHHSSMARLKESEKRGRPDLVHVALLSVTGTPLYLEGHVKVFVHTFPGLVLELEPKTRIPKNYLRFRGLMEKALVEQPEKGLVSVYRSTVPELVKRRSKSDLIIAFSIRGKMENLGDVSKEVAEAKSPAVIVGGFPHGHFSSETLSVPDRLVRIDESPLEAHVVASRVVYEVEKVSRRMND